MARATITKELYCEAPDETGLLGRIISTFKVQDISIVHLSADTVQGRGILRMITKDNEKARKAIQAFIPKIEEKEVLVVEFENKVGTLAQVAILLGSNDVRIHSIYGTSGDGFKIVGVFSTADNARARDLINEDSGALGISST